MRQFIAVTIAGVVALAAMFPFGPLVEAQQLTSIRLQPRPTEPLTCSGGSNIGAIYFDQISGLLKVCGDTSWGNIDNASAQAIFKNIANSSGATQFSAASNSDMVRFSGAGAASVSFPGSNTVQITSVDTNSGGTVTSVGGTAPISSTGGVTPQISLSNGGVTFAHWASNSCGANQIPKWNGAAWACANDVDTDTNNYTSAIAFSGAGTKTLTLSRSGLVDITANFTDIDTNSGGTITGVTAGTGLFGGGTSGTVTLTNTGIISAAAGTGISVAGTNPLII
ncbi:MAG: hypothetical protein Q7S84_04610, partial [bacterium]|nr:hypothetical protein [bacterium]